jgi:hypothetical protein
MPYSDEIAKKTAPFANDGMDLAQETAIGRYLLQEAITQGSYGMATALLSVIPKITAAQLAADIRAGNTLPASTVLMIARGIVEAVNKRLEEADVPNREAILDSLIGDVQDLFTRAKEQHRLTDTRGRLA